MRVHITQLGVINRPIDGLSRWYHIYFLEAENGLVDEDESEDVLEDGDYELPDEDWRIE